MSFILSLFTSPLKILAGVLSFFAAHWLLGILLVALILFVVIGIASKFSIFGSISTGLSNIFGGSNSGPGLTIYAIGAILLLGMVAFYFYQVDQYNSTIATLTAQNTTLQDNIKALTLSNQSLNQEITAEQQNAVQLENEIAAINTVDNNSNSVLNNVIVTDLDNKNQAANIAKRNATASQQSFIADANSNMSCYFTTFSNGQTGDCVNGKFTAYTGTTSSK